MRAVACRPRRLKRSGRAPITAEVCASTGVFVLGMHRSGTSATTRLIHALGVPVNVPADWMAPGPDNPKGFWESTALARFNDDLLAALGGTWDHPPAPPGDWRALDGSAAWRDRARRLFPALFPTPQWVWKDPRTCLTFPFWREALAVRPVVVLAHRNPLEVVRSLQSRDRFAPGHAVALWERYVRASLAAARGLPVFVADYARMMADPLGWCGRLRAFLAAQGVATEREERWHDEVESFLDRGLRHSVHSTAEVAGDPHAGRLAGLLGFLEAAEGAHDRFAAPAEITRESEETEALFAATPPPRPAVARPERLVSVVVALDGDPAAARATAESVAAQAHGPVETFLVDGDGAALDAGIAASGGEYLLLLRAGDRLGEGSLERCVRMLDVEEGASIAYCDRQEPGGGVLRAPAYDLWRLTRANLVGPSALLRREAWEAAGGHAPLEVHADWDLWLACGERGHTGVRVPGAVLHPRAQDAPAPERERRARAQIVLRHPRLYALAEVEWAAGVLAGAPEAPTAPDAPGAMPELGGMPPALSGERLPGVRGRAVLVVAGELVADDRLGAALAGLAEADEVTVLLAGAVDAGGGLAPGLEAALAAHGLDGDDGPDLLATPLSGAQLAQHADAILTLAAPAPVFSGLPQLAPALHQEA